MTIKRKRTRLSVLKGVWRDQVFYDREITPLCFKIAYFLVDRITMDETAATYRRNGDIEIWGSQKKIAKAVGCNASYVSECISQLRKRKHLRLLKRGNHLEGSNIYQVIIKEVGEDERKERSAYWKSQ
jgi:hypothetical protein